MSAKCTGGLAHLKDIRKQIADGGVVQFHWQSCWSILVRADGEWFTTIDGRSYHAFLETADTRYSRTETGSTEQKNLVIEWRKKG
jgi:hypothetical protein